MASYAQIDLNNLKKGALTTQGQPVTNTDDVKEQFRQNRDFTYGRGEDLNNQLNGVSGGSQSRADAYRNQAHGAYEPLLGGYSGPGYSPEEQAAIMRDQEMNGLRTSQDHINSLYLGAEDQRNIMGNPYEARQFFRPGQIDTINQDGTGQMRSAYGDQATAMRGSIDPTALRQMSSYGSGQDAIMNASDAGVRGAITDSLKMDSGFADRVRMTDRDVQDYQDRAARNVHNQKQAALDEIEQRAISSGNTSPLAMGALRNRYEQGAQVNSADAMLDARLGAKSQQADREFGIEGIRQQGENAYAGLRSNAEMQMGNRRVGEYADRENMRIGAEQGATDRSLATERTIGDNRLQSEQGIYDRNMNSEQWKQQTGADLWQQGDDRATNRSMQIAQNLQDNGRWAADTQFNQGMQVANNQANKAGMIADARRTDQSEGRGWLQHNIDQQNNNVNTANQQKISLYGTTAGALQSNAGTASQYDMARRNSGFGAAFKNSLGAGLGSGLGRGIASGFTGG